MVRDDDIGGEDGADDQVQEVDTLGQLPITGVIVSVVVPHH